MTTERSVTLFDGTRGIVRPIAPEDRNALVEAFSELHPESRIRRFFFEKKSLSESELARLTNPDGVNHIAYGLAVESEDSTEEHQPISVGRCFRDEKEDDLAEIALVTADLWQGNGAGAELMRSLSHASLNAGIQRWYAMMMSDNEPMTKLLDRFGEKCEERRVGSGIIEAIYRIVEPPEGFFEEE